MAGLLDHSYGDYAVAAALPPPATRRDIPHISFPVEQRPRLAAGLLDDGRGDHAVAVTLLRLRAGGDIARELAQLVHHVVGQLLAVRQLHNLTIAADEPDAADVVDVVKEDRAVLAHKGRG